MFNFKIFGKKTGSFNEEVISALKQQKEGELLPDDGVFTFLYEKLDGPSIPLMVCAKKTTEYIYIDNEEFISLTRDAKPEWIIGKDRNIVRLIMMYNINGSQLLINFIFDVDNEISRNAINLLIKTKEFSLTYLNMLYGGLVLDSRTRFRLPENIISDLKKV